MIGDTQHLVSEIDFTITNHGLIAAENAQLNLPNTEIVVFVPIVDGPIGDIAANSRYFSSGQS